MNDFTRRHRPALFLRPDEVSPSHEDAVFLFHCPRSAMKNQIAAVKADGGMMTLMDPRAVFAAACGLVLAATPAGATVRQGVEFWRAGDYKSAVTEWLPFAAQGNADALFNLGQAYKLGRGVTKDLTIAEDYYRKAAALGHGAARANLGILLFQSGRKAEGLRWLEQAANQGEGRAQYIVGIAYFNGDTVRRDRPLAYAYMLRANNAGVPQAAATLDNMNANMSVNDRARGEEIAAALASGVSPQALAEAPVAPRRIANPIPRPAPAEGNVAGPTAATPLASSSAVIGTAAAAAPPQRPASDGQPGATAWRVQLGAFSQREMANEAWVALKATQPALADRTPLFVPQDNVIRLQLGPFAQRDDARQFCLKLVQTGQSCFVVPAP